MLLESCLELLPLLLQLLELPAIPIKLVSSLPHLQSQPCPSPPEDTTAEEATAEATATAPAGQAPLQDPSANLTVQDHPCEAWINLECPELNNTDIVK